MKNTIVKVWLDLSGEPIIHNGAISYQKGDFFCVYEEDKERVFKYPIAHIWRIEESYLPEQRAHLTQPEPKEQAMKQKCLNCKSWERNYDPCVGWCQSFNGWRFQFEGNDCEDYEFFEERAPGKPSYMPEPKKARAKRLTKG